ncbi:MAG TPA: hypothetical protein DDY97_03015 [Prevotella sp.]|jgi:hypothetical protein|nr:hypothetical protein [Prevotella sp.]
MVQKEIQKIKRKQRILKKVAKMLVTFISISRISTARHPSGFEIRCKKMFNLLNPGICNPVNKQKRSGF